MPSQNNSFLVKDGPESRHALMKSHDDELFVSPRKTDAAVDPFSPDVIRHLQIAPQNQ
jgi:hypothetical protein